MTHLKNIGLLLGMGAAVAACSNAPVAPPPPSPVASAPAPAPSPAKPAAATTPVASPLPPYLDPKSPLSSKRSVYFDYDVFTIGSEYGDLLAMHGKYLSAHPGVSIKVEGNADERGSPEYNLALGQKRAQAVAQALKVYGVQENQVEAVSFGEERPKATAHDEPSWAENRRADLVYPAK